jgi:hypothetical protein
MPILRPLIELSPFGGLRSATKGQVLLLVAALS